MKTNNQTGQIEAICTSHKKGVAKETVTSAKLIIDHGIEGDAHAGKWHRQVSVLDAADVEKMRQKGATNLKHGSFGENIVVSGTDISKLGLGSIIKIGNNVELSVTQLGKKCHSHCAIYYQVGDCIMPRLGLFARVTKDGSIAVGDSVEVTSTVARKTFQVVVLTISDRCSKGEAVDTAGPAVATLITNEMDAHIYAEEILPDEQKQIEEKFKHYADGHSIDMVIAVGGTGFSPRDITPEAITAVIDRPTPGLDEVMRATSLQKTNRAMLSRATSGIRESTLIISLPGSEKASVENLAAIIPALSHGLEKLRGDPSDCGRG